jgi:hypothetical protein
MYQMRELKWALKIRCDLGIYFQSKTIISIIICCSILFPYLDSISAKVIHQVHPPPVQIFPGPPKQFLERAYFYKWGCKDVIKALKDSGLEVVDITGGITVGSPAATENTVFLMPSYGEEIGGVVSSYDSERKLLDSLNYYSSMNKDPQFPAWRIFRKDNILLLISGMVPEEKALEYDNALSRMKK